MRIHNEGFTIVELSVSIAIVALLAVLTTPNIMLGLQSNRTQRAIEDTQTIIDAARAYRIANQNWPDGETGNNCQNALAELTSGTPKFLLSASAFNIFGNAYSTSCTKYTFSLDQAAVPDWDGVMVNTLGGTTIVNPSNSMLRTTIGIPGSETALDTKLSRIATGNAEHNRMQTTLFLGGQDIREVGELISAEIDTTTLGVRGLTKLQGQTEIGSTLTVDGNTTLKSNAKVDGSISVYGNGYFYAPVTFASNVNVTGKLTVNSDARILGNTIIDGTTTLNKELVTNSHIRLTKIETVGQSCAANGSLAISSDGGLINCKGSKWVAVGNTPETAIAGHACTETGSLGKTSIGELMSCVSGVWTKPGAPMLSGEGTGTFNVTLSVSRPAIIFIQATGQRQSVEDVAISLAVGNTRCARDRGGNLPNNYSHASCFKKVNAGNVRLSATVQDTYGAIDDSNIAYWSYVVIPQ